MSELNALIAEAKALGENITLDFLNDAVQRLDASVPEGSTATFSSGGAQLNFNGDLAKDVVSNLSLDTADATGSARITSIPDTDVGKFLQNGDVVQAIDNAGLLVASNAATSGHVWPRLAALGELHRPATHRTFLVTLCRTLIRVGLSTWLSWRRHWVISMS